MSNQRPLNVGLVGYGFMGRTHSNAFGKVNQFFDLDHRPVLKAICGRNEANVKAFAAQWGYQSTETDWRKLLSRSDIDLIDIATPNDSHAEIAIAAAQAGKMVMCEKPLGRNPAESAHMVAAVETAKTPISVWYNYRRVPAVMLLNRSSTTNARRSFITGSQVSAGLDDLEGPAARRRRAMAAHANVAGVA